MTEPVIVDTERGVRYACPFCPFDTGDPETAAEHITWRHRGETLAPVVAPKPKRRREMSGDPLEDLGIALAPEE